MAKCQAFLSEEQKIPSGSLRRHLNVIITEPDEEQNYLVVPVTTYRTDKADRPFSGQDESCILPAKCHSFITSKSFVNYKFARVMSAFEILVGLKKGLLIKKEDMDKKYVQDMQMGAELSPNLPEEFHRFFEFFHVGVQE